MNATDLATSPSDAAAGSRDPAIESGTESALRFMTCGSVDDGKSTLIGRLLLDSRSVLQDQLASVSHSGSADLALLTDGLTAEREQGITIDVAYRYFNTAKRKFIIADAPGHVQYTRNMVTAASSVDCAVVLVDATKLQWQDAPVQLLAQTRRHSLLVNLLRVPSIVFAVNKLDAVAEPELAFCNIRAALETFAAAAGIEVVAALPISALLGHNVVEPAAHWCGYDGPSLLQLLEQLPAAPAQAALPLAFPVQWVEKFSASSDTNQGRRVFWGRVAAGHLQAGQEIRVMPGGQTATVAQVVNRVRIAHGVMAGHSAGVILDRELDVSRGDWLLAADGADPDADSAGTGPVAVRELAATIAWMDDQPLVAGRVYWALHGHRWVKARVRRIAHRLNVDTLDEEAADQIEPNAIGHVELLLQEPLAVLPYRQSRVLGSMVLVDTASHATSGAVLVN